MQGLVQLLLASALLRALLVLSPQELTMLQRLVWH